MRFHYSAARLSGARPSIPWQWSLDERPRSRIISRELSRFRHQLNSVSIVKSFQSNVAKYALQSRHRFALALAMDEDSVGISSFNDWLDKEVVVECMFSSSDDEDSDEEIILHPVTDTDLPNNRENVRTTDDGLTMTAHRLAMLGRTRKKIRSKYGILNNMVLISFLIVLLLLLDWCIWKVVRLPLAPFFLTRPFLVSAVLVSCAGFACVPLFRCLGLCTMIKKQRPARFSSKKKIPTMGGLFFVPIGVIVAELTTGFSSTGVNGTAVGTLAFAVIGLLNDLCSIAKNKNRGISRLMILLEVIVGMWFSIWLYTADISSPYSMKTVVPLPAPIGLICLGKYYTPATTFCFASMAYGINITDGLDGLVGGIAALAFVGMSIAVLPICPDLAIFGASLAGACFGFLLHNRYKASVFMGNTGSLAIGGALAAMAACTGMFFPLFISSGIFVLEAISVIMQVFFNTTKCIWGSRHGLVRMSPLHHQLELRGFKEPVIVAYAYAISSLLVLCAGYFALISA